MGKRIFDIVLAFILIVIMLPIIIIVSLMVKFSSKGPILYWSKRVGIHNSHFHMPKFRSMRINTPTKATHLLEKPDQYLTLIGGFIRKSSLDELPQLYSILVGHMSFVGPRPALFNQDDLIKLRTLKGVHILKPGLTGWAQVNGRDELPIPVKVAFDETYLHRRALFFDLHIIWLTILKVIKREGITH